MDKKLEKYVIEDNVSRAATPNRVVKILDTILADEVVLFVQTLKSHWSVTGPSFKELHDIFADQLKELLVVTDHVAERTRTIGQHPISTIPEFVQATNIKENAEKIRPAAEFVEELLESHETIIKLIKDNLQFLFTNEPGTYAFLSGILQQHERMAWMLRSYLEDK
jgi:starvation-inducible DNA-binding protein